MPRNRTTPAPRPDVAEDRVMQFGMVIGYGGGSYDADNTYFEYTANNLDENGNVVNSHVRRIYWTDLPAAAKTDLKALFNKVLTDAENQGLIGSGTDSGDPA